MLVGSVNAITQVNSREGPANLQFSASSAHNNSPIPEDTVTLSPAAQALQTEQKILAAAAENRLSPSGGEAAATSWRSALALISE